MTSSFMWATGRVKRHKKAPYTDGLSFVGEVFLDQSDVGRSIQEMRNRQADRVSTENIVNKR